MVKVRNGFVSNSSTCSFIVAGWKTLKTFEEIAEIFDIEYKNEDELWDIMYNHEFIHPYGDEIFFGVEIAQWNDDAYCNDMQVTLPELIEKLTRISEISKKLNLDAKKASIYSGVYMC